jgi:hypothetical protein
MQREKLYNLHNKAYLNYMIFVFKKKQNSVQLIFAIAKPITQSFPFFENKNNIIKMCFIA